MSTPEEWIQANKDPSDPLKGRGKCKDLAGALAQAFPELRLVAGYYYDIAWGPQQHWWCVDASGKVFDPTADQFPTKGRGVYEEVAVEDRPVGVCMECGDDVFRDSPAAPHFCSKECGDTYGAYCF